MSKRINIILPDKTVAVLDRVASKGTRSRFIDRAVRHYVETQGRASLQEQLKAGYRANADRDLAMAAEWFPLEEEAWQTSEASRTPKKSTKTRYRPQTFGGILQYASRAVTAYADIRRREQAAAKLRAETNARREFDVLNADLAEKRRASAEAQLEALPPAEQQSLRARVRAELLQYHWVNESSPVFEQMLHRRMLSEVMQKMTE
jgi:CopG family transcriptional regulator/antitoxin EndoAI